jgi:hypothetical protein
MRRSWSQWQPPSASQSVGTCTAAGRCGTSCAQHWKTSSKVGLSCNRNPDDGPSWCNAMQCRQPDCAAVLINQPSVCRHNGH